MPAFTSACPNSGGNVAKADLEEALFFQGSDGKADEILIAAGTFTENGGFGAPDEDREGPRWQARQRRGRHAFRVWAVDRAGNKDPSAAKRRFLVPG